MRDVFDWGTVVFFSLTLWWMSWTTISERTMMMNTQRMLRNEAFATYCRLRACVGIDPKRGGARAENLIPPFPPFAFFFLVLQRCCSDVKTGRWRHWQQFFLIGKPKKKKRKALEWSPWLQTGNAHTLCWCCYYCMRRGGGGNYRASLLLQIAVKFLCTLLRQVLILSHSTSVVFPPPIANRDEIWTHIIAAVTLGVAWRTLMVAQWHAKWSSTVNGGRKIRQSFESESHEMTEARRGSSFDEIFSAVVAHRSQHNPARLDHLLPPRRVGWNWNCKGNCRLERERVGIGETNFVAQSSFSIHWNLRLSVTNKLLERLESDKSTWFINPTGDNVQQELNLHPADYRHDGIAPVSGHAAAKHLKRTRLHNGLLHHIQAVAGRIETHLGNHPGNQGTSLLSLCLIQTVNWFHRQFSSSGLIRQRAAHAGGQQVRRNGREGADGQRGRGSGEKVVLSFYGDICQNEPQCQGALPRTAQFGQESVHVAAARFKEQGEQIRIGAVRKQRRQWRILGKN